MIILLLHEGIQTKIGTLLRKEEQTKVFSAENQWNFAIHLSRWLLKNETQGQVTKM